MAAAVTENFLNGGAWNKSFVNNTFNSENIRDQGDKTRLSYSETLSQLQNSSSNLTKLTNSECQSAFGTPKIQSPYLNILVVTNLTSNNSFIDGLLFSPETGMDTFPWFNKTFSRASSYQCRGTEFNYTQGQSSDSSIPICTCSNSSSSSCSVDQNRAFVQDCLVQPVGDFGLQCTISISLKLLIAVIVCNALKAICFVCTLRAKSFHPLATVGDAVASFLDRPDPTTIACGPLQALKIENPGVEFLGINGPWTQKIRNWKKAYVWRSEKKARKWGHAIKTIFGIFAVVG